MARYLPFAYVHTLEAWHVGLRIPTLIASVYNTHLSRRVREAENLTL